MEQTYTDPIDDFYSFGRFLRRFIARLLRRFLPYEYECGMGFHGLHGHGHLEVHKDPWFPSRNRGEMAMAMVAMLHVYGVHQMLSPFLTVHEVFTLKSIVDGAVGHNRGEMAETPFLARTQGRTVGDTPHVSLCRVSFKGSNPHTLWRALGQLEPVRRSRTRVDTDTSRGFTRPEGPCVFKGF